MKTNGPPPSEWQNITWWILFTIAGIWAQYVVPGVDLLLAGVIVSLQEERRSQTWWLCATFVLIQDGSGLLAFGPSVLWYSMAVALFFMGRWLLEAKNIVFIFLLSIAIGTWHVGLALMMSTLQNIPIDIQQHIYEGILQAILTPLCWFVLNIMRSRFTPHANAA